MKNKNILLWQRRFADKESSGLKLTEWCAQNQISRSYIRTGETSSRTRQLGKHWKHLKLDVF